MILTEYIENEIRDRLYSLNYDRASFIPKHLISNIHKELIKSGSCSYRLIFDSYENHKGFSYPYLSDILIISDISMERNINHVIYFDKSKYRNDKISQLIC